MHHLLRVLLILEPLPATERHSLDVADIIISLSFAAHIAAVQTPEAVLVVHTTAKNRNAAFLSNLEGAPIHWCFGDWTLFQFHTHGLHDDWRLYQNTWGTFLFADPLGPRKETENKESETPILTCCPSEETLNLCAIHSKK